jgi:flavin-dependent dehydrogenase
MSGPDVLVVGGGPAGLAAAIACAQAGLSTTVVERRLLPVDKACGEGLLPQGVRALGVLGVRIAAGRDAMPLRAVHYLQEEGRSARALLPDGGGLGIRRTVLSAVLAARARALGVELRTGHEARLWARDAAGLTVLVSGVPLRARLLVAADGVRSRLAVQLGLALPAPPPRRFGIRRHYRCPPWGDFVEVHFAAGVEAYVTPVASERVGVALLFEPDALGERSFDALLSRLPRLLARLAGAPAEDPVRGAGPLGWRVKAQVCDRVVLIGDAAGYVDAITGEGLSLAFACARDLGALAPGALARGATRSELLPYQRAWAHHFRRHALVTRALLALAGRPRWRRRTVEALCDHPALFERIVAWATAA